SMNEGIGFLADMFTAKVTRERLKLIRDSWPGTLVIKGVLDTEDAEMCVSLGADALVISNHGGRQFDAAPSPLEVLDEIRSTVGSEMPLLVDGGVRSGLDVARCIARGADFVLMGRAFYYAIAALGNKGGNHVMSILLDELDKTMTQLGCSSVDELPNFLSDRKNDAINSH
ncbi:MAG: alpha-hydroxy acid oxidase, partial [Pirellulales bacterium]|nr:alpha-hydroxy acid oxidase [Pirellulales bacterium]